MNEELFDIEGATHLHLKYGDRFEGWYLFKKFLRHETMPLGYKGTDLTYRFVICDFNCRFVMPAQIKFSGGIISYSDAERELGVFRFPRNEQGDFTAPITLQKDKGLVDVSLISDEDLKNILKRQKPLVFEAFRIPQHGFELFDLTDHILKEIESVTDESFVKGLKEKYDTLFEEKMAQIRDNILGRPNNLLILKNVLDRKMNLDEVSIASDTIIHIG